MTDILIKIYYDRSKWYVSQKVYSNDMRFDYGFFGMSSGVECKITDTDADNGRCQYGGDYI